MEAPEGHTDSELLKWCQLYTNVKAPYITYHFICTICLRVLCFQLTTFNRFYYEKAVTTKKKAYLVK